GQPRPLPPRRPLAGSLPRPPTHHPPRGAARARVRADESPEHHGGERGAGSLFVARVLRRLAGARPDGTPTGARRPRAHLAGPVGWRRHGLLGLEERPRGVIAVAASGG